MATYKGIGYDTANAKTRTGTNADSIQFDAQIDGQDGLTITGDASFSADVSVGGSLDVAGDIISRGAVDLVIQDNFIDLNFANSTTTAESGGLTIQMNRTSSFTAGTVTTFVAGIASTSNPTFTYTDAGSSSALAAGDVVVINGAADSENNGIYVVSAVNQATFPQVVTIKGVGTVATNAATPWAQTQFTAASGNTATAFKTDIFIQLVADGTAAFTDSGGGTYSKGTFLTAYHTNANETAFTNDGGYTTVESTLQSAYNGGNSILTAGTSPIAFTLGADAAGLDVNGNSAGDGIVSIGGGTSVHSITLAASGAASAFTSTGQNLTFQTASSGVLTVSSAGELDLTAAGVMDVNANANLDVAVTGTMALVSTDTANFTMAANVASDKIMTIAATNGNVGNVSNIDMDADGTVDIDGAGGINIGKAADVAIDIDSSTLDIDASGAITIDGDTSISVQSATSSDITMAANTGSTQTLTIAASNADGSNVSAIDVDADGAITIDAGTGISLQGGAASDLSTSSGELTLAASNAAGGITLNAGTGGVDIDITAAGSGSGNGALTVNAGAASTIDVAAGNLTLQTTTSGNVQLAAAADISGTFSNNSATAFDLSDGTSYFKINTATTTTQVLFGAADVVIDTQGAGTQFVTNLNVLNGVAVGDLLYINSSGQLDKADADAILTARVVGIAAEANSTGGAASRMVMASVGQLSLVTFNSAPSAGDRGKPVYVHTTAGQATLTAPTASGDVVFRIGYLYNHTAIGGLYQVLFQPAFVMEIG